MEFPFPLPVTDPPELLYHYTSAVGLLGIVESRRLWATHIRFLNDTSEYSYGREVIMTALERFDLPDFLKELQTKGDLLGMKDVVVCSLTEKRDDLSQWRGYGDSGRGFSIGFCGQALQGIARPETSPFCLAKCIYDEAEQWQTVEKYLGEFRECSRDDFVRRAHVYLSFLSVIFKHPAFTEEDEWRLLGAIQMNPEHSIKFRRGKLNLVPYVEFNFEDKFGNYPIREMIAGPSSDPETARLSLELLKGEHCPQARVTTSEIPYRCW